MGKDKLLLESTIMVALFKATIEQTTMITGHYNKKPKEIFNQWQRVGFRLLEELEKNSIVDAEGMDMITDYYHNINIELRKSNKQQ